MPVGISVIVPCYNAEDYIIRCLDSIGKCGYDNYEVILVDDCSTDRTVSKIEEYVQINDFPATLLKNAVNLGPGLSRNAALEAAKKEYITFVDADDMIEPDFFHDVSEAIDNNGSDCVIFDAIRVINGHPTYLKMFYGDSFDQGPVDKGSALVFVRGGSWGKVYRTSVIRENGVQFPPQKRNEDTVFTKIALSFCSGIYYLSKAYYTYTENMQSLVHDNSLLDTRNAFTAFDMINTALAGRGFDEELHSMYLLEVVYSTTTTTVRQNRDNKLCRQHYRRVTDNYIIRDKYYSRYTKKYRFLLWLMRIGCFGGIRFLLKVKG